MTRKKLHLIDLPYIRNINGEFVILGTVLLKGGTYAEVHFNWNVKEKGFPRKFNANTLCDWTVRGTSLHKNTDLLW
jgi:hypothetical protein